MREKHKKGELLKSNEKHKNEIMQTTFFPKDPLVKDTKIHKNKG
jgi:hypothetical protein